ncbi:hypothetical protein AAG570_004736 [Ranatra chinensis]|uniref:Uncharacterized protein n=1 Tax=Ranatra chinensis TaxID=642074 RepID=A0ABD0YQ82_9HEMI
MAISRNRFGPTNSEQEWRAGPATQECIAGRSGAMERPQGGGLSPGLLVVGVTLVMTGIASVMLTVAVMTRRWETIVWLKPALTQITANFTDKKVDAFKSRVWIPCHSLAYVQAKVADTASGRDWIAMKNDGGRSVSEGERLSWAWFRFCLNFTGHRSICESRPPMRVKDVGSNEASNPTRSLPNGTLTFPFSSGPDPIDSAAPGIRHWGNPAQRLSVAVQNPSYDPRRTLVALDWLLDGDVARLSVRHPKKARQNLATVFLVPMHGGIWTLCVDLTRKIIIKKSQFKLAATGLSIPDDVQRRRFPGERLGEPV